MENKRISIDELNKLSKETISMLYLQTFEMLQNLQAQNANLITQVEDLKQQMAILINQRFGKRSEKLSQLPGQLSFNIDDPAVFNEIEVITDHGFAEEPSLEEVVPEHIRRKRPKGKRAVDLSGIEVEVVNHYLPEDILNSEMPRDGIKWKMKSTQNWSGSRLPTRCWSIMWVFMPAMGMAAKS